MPDATASLRSRLMATGVPVLCGLGYALLMLAATWGLWWCALPAIAPLAWCAWRPGARPVRDGLLVAAGTLPYWALTQSWVREISEFGYPPMVLALALLGGMFVALLAFVRRWIPGVACGLAAPALWTGIECARGEWIVGGYAWGFVAHPLIDSPGAALMASKGGVYLVSAFVAMLVGMGFDTARTWRVSGRVPVLALAAMALMTAVFLVPDLRRTPAGRSVRVAAVQTNIPQSLKMDWGIAEEVRDMRRFEELTRAAAATGAEFIAWPETMMPGITLEPDAIERMDRAGLGFNDETSGAFVEAAWFAERLARLSAEVRVPLLVGEEAREGFRIVEARGGLRMPYDRRYNSVYMLVDGALSATRYDKVRLTPFGEVMPFVHRWPALQQRVLDFGARGMVFDLRAGRDLTVFDVPAASGAVRVVTPICFEVTDAALCRRMVFAGGQRRADLIVNVTNDGWFGDNDAGKAQHLLLARWRSAELGTPMVRAANTGISALIDARGRVVAQGVDGERRRTNVDGVLAGELLLGEGATLYARVGDVAGWVAFAGAWGLLGVAGARAWKARRDGGGRGRPTPARTDPARAGPGRTGAPRGG